MKRYKQLTIEQRYQIYGLKKAGFTQSAIADELKVDKGTISRELKRNAGKRGWRPKQAQEKSVARRQACKNASQFSSEDFSQVDVLIRQKLSPEQVSGRMAFENTLAISHETIYAQVYADKRAGGDLWRHLRCQKHCRKRYASGHERRGVLKNRVGIAERPGIVDLKERIGDWEGDTVIGKGHKGARVTLADRASRYPLATLLPSKHAEGVTAAITGLLGPHQSKRHTVTFDNGKEFAGHEEISKALEVAVYFAHPYHSWERGLNENINGLLRQYFPKGARFETVTEDEVQAAVTALNHRPRKVLGFRSPYEVFFGQRRRYTSSAQAVALRA